MKALLSVAIVFSLSTLTLADTSVDEVLRNQERIGRRLQRQARSLGPAQLDTIRQAQQQILNILEGRDATGCPTPPEHTFMGHGTLYVEKTTGVFEKFDPPSDLRLALASGVVRVHPWSDLTETYGYPFTKFFIKVRVDEITSPQFGLEGWYSLPNSLLQTFALSVREPLEFRPTDSEWTSKTYSSSLALFPTIEANQVPDSTASLSANGGSIRLQPKGTYLPEWRASSGIYPYYPVEILSVGTEDRVQAGTRWFVDPTSIALRGEILCIGPRPPR